ncbi:MAG: hypothetical protein DCF19_08045 [Pseudanabaena frigida]|uniref:CHAT domain-containing protein n=1 Tax=Pseudanabaena frigida TaxID=945775 RepID=A0A2W4Y5B6_9CYAN|nr:MAG: hypothetical protein DCF19_08045 [Pseudanabaena frigida]
MTSWLRSIACVLTISVLSLGLPPNHPLTTAQAQSIQQNRSAEAARLFNQGLQQVQASQYQQALQSSQQALQIYRELNDPNQASAHLLIGNIYLLLGQYENATSSFLQTLEIARAINNAALESKALNNLGATYFALGQYQKALEFNQKSLAIAKSSGDRQMESITLGLLGNSYVALGKYQKALEFYQQYLTAAKSIGDRGGEAYALGNIGNTYAYLGQYQKAIEWLQQSLTLVKAIGDRRGEGKAIENLGNTYAYLGKFQQAIAAYQEALAIYKQIGDRNGEATALGNLGKAFNDLGQYPQAVAYLEQTLAIARSIKDRQGEAATLGNLGITYNLLKQYEKAIDFSQQQMLIAKELGERRAEASAFAQIGYALSKLERTDIAIAVLKSSISITEEIRKDIRSLSKEDRQSYVGTVSDRYRYLADLLLQENRVIEALQIIDLLKIQELEDYLKNIKGSDRASQWVRILEPEKAISSQLSAFSLEQIAELNRKLASQIQQIPKSEINKVPQYLQKLPQGSVLIYPLILSDRIEIILFSPNTLPISRTVKISKDKLESLIVEYRVELRDATSEDIKASSKALYDVLIKPIEAELVAAKADAILYAPDGLLRYVPLAALYNSKTWLIEKYRISNLISYNLFDFSAKPRSKPNILAGAFGGKAGEKKFGQFGLPATLTEVQAIANAFQNSVTLTEEAFSRQAIESKFKDRNILHLATHAEFNTGVPDNSFIIFGNGDKIRLNEISDWQIPNIDLIVLSACETGTGALGNGVEILGFGYQVQKAGAKNAIASLWNVNDEGTQALMAVFYDELKKGDVTSTEALHRAQIALIKSPKYKHPNYWSAFFAIGNGL